MADREELARCCLEVEQAGGNVLTFLKECGYVSTWGTWYRLQIEQLGRKKELVAGGRGEDTMGKITLEQKKKAVAIAMEGGDVLGFLKKCGSKNPSAHWYVIKKNLKEADPMGWELLSRVKEDKPVTCCAPSTREGVEVPDDVPEEEPEKPEVVLTIKSEDLTRVSSITKPVNYDGFEITGLKTDYGRFQVSNNGYLFFGADQDELEMPLEIWRKFAEDLPRVMVILGI